MQEQRTRLRSLSQNKTTKKQNNKTLQLTKLLNYKHPTATVIPAKTQMQASQQPHRNANKTNKDTSSKQTTYRAIRGALRPSGVLDSYAYVAFKIVCFSDKDKCSNC